MTDYPTTTEHGEGWTMLLGDSCERLAELEDDSIDLSVYSPPFASLFTYSPSERDIGNCKDLAEFLVHYRFVIDRVLRVTKPGRMSGVHVAQTVTQKARDGFKGMVDLRSGVIAEHQAAGWIYYGEAAIQKNPQAAATRTHDNGLLFVQLRRDSTVSRPGLADYLLIFKRPGDNAVPVNPVANGDMTQEDWIAWAHPCWTGIRETSTLNAAIAREDADERHLCPLQLPLIDRVVRLYSNPGELVLSPFAGIGSEGYQSILRGRRFVGCELKPSYFATACGNLAKAVAVSGTPTLLDELAEVVA